MKKAVLITICCVFVMCSGAILATASAGLAAYSLPEYFAQTTTTIDGKWTAANEWTDAYIGPLSFNGVFGYKMEYGDTLAMVWLIEPFFAGTNNNPGDIAQVCIDGSNDGGTVPKSDDYKIEIVGHTTCNLYQGNGNGWTKVTANPMVWSNTLTTSPRSNQTHWVIEIKNPDKQGTALPVGQPPNGMRAAYFDAATNKWSDWAPNGDGTKPDTWGVISGFSQDPIPEGFSVIFIAVLSTIAAAGALTVRRLRNIP